MDQPQIFLYPASFRSVNGTKWGYINDRGQFMISPQYETASNFQENGLAIVQLQGKYGVLNLYGKYVVPPKYEWISSFIEQRAVVIDEEGFKVIDERGNLLTSKAYDFIATYQQGRAVAGITDEKENERYGYLDLQGREIIPLKYRSASDFHENKAVIQMENKTYALIGRRGEMLQSYPYAFVGALGDGLLAFQKEENGKVGFIDLQGNVIISPRYTGVQRFEGGRAIVNIAEGYMDRYGLIDTRGGFILQPIYDDMLRLENQRIAIGKATYPAKPFLGKKYAVADTNGRIFTGFLYDWIVPYEHHVASATDGKYTFFINEGGQRVQNLPWVEGSGVLSFVGRLIRVDVDYRTSYITRNGRLVWKQNTVVFLRPPYKVVEEKYKPNKDYLVYYPQIHGMGRMQEPVNDRLKQLSQIKYIPPNVQLEESYLGDFSIYFYKKNLLVLQLDGYRYPFGAAHGMPTKIYPHINLVSGQFYQLEDLFKKGSSYVAVLSEIVGKQIKEDPQYSYVFPDAYQGIRKDQPFYVGEDALYIYFEPYEIAPYAAGFVTFKIPYFQIMNIIDTQGTFWKSFHD